MARRDVGNEVVVALAVIGMLALALTFAVVLTLSRTVPPPSQTATASASTAVALISQAPTISVVPATLPPTAATTAQPTASAAPSQAATQTTATSTTTETPIPPTTTSSPTIIPTNTNSPTSTLEPSPTLTLVSQPSENATVAPTLTLQSVPTVQVAFTTTTSVPSLPDAITSATPITDAGILPTAIGGSGVTVTPTPCTRPGNWIPYTIRPGDTLFAISVRYGVSLQQLQASNCLANTGSIYAGQVILVPPNILPTTFYATNSPMNPTTSPGGSGNAALCPDPNVRITNPISGSAFSSKFAVVGTANIPNFSYYFIDYRFYTEWDKPFNSFGHNLLPVTNGLLMTFDPAPSRLPPGSYTLRLHVVDKNGNSPAPCAIQFVLQ